MFANSQIKEGDDSVKF